MLYLIDGYNLLYAMGVLTARTGPAGMEPARRRLLDLLQQAHGTTAHDVTVVFDARRLPHGVAAEQEYRGIQVRYAVRYPEADDLLEQLIHECTVPSGLAVVSDDRRIQDAARRRGCVVLPCAAYLEELTQARPREKRAPVADDQKPAEVTAEESAYWRQAFADLDDSAAMKELFEIPWSEGPITP